MDATHGFNKLLKIGEGGFGGVYKGTISPLNGRVEPIVVAIKKLNKQGLQGHKEWLAEVQFLGILNYPNLVKLLGYCSIDREGGIHRLLVYEFMPNQSLEDHLFKSTSTLPWKTRLEIMIGAAQGLAYLHEGLEVKVIYRDFKSSNMLLDESFKPKLSGFGLAREGIVLTLPLHLVSAKLLHFILAGHYAQTIDILTGGGRDIRICCPGICENWPSHSPKRYMDLWGGTLRDPHREANGGKKPANVGTKAFRLGETVPSESKKFSMIMDPRLRNSYSLSAAQKVEKLADSCLNKNAKERPTMGQVVERLK